MGLTRTFPIDTALQLEDGAAAITATEVNANADGAAYLDLGDGGLVHGAVVINVSAMVLTDDQDYTIELQGGTDTSFTAATCKVLATLGLGAHEVTGATPAQTGADNGTGTYYVPFCNDFAGTTYRYVRLAIFTVGASESITYTAYLSTQRTMG